MRTPAGKECRFYYEDFNRGRNIQECRLLKRATGNAKWRPGDCNNCSVPGILWANASEHLELRATIQPGFLGFGRRITVLASCNKHQVIITDPYAGCPECARERPGLGSLLSKDES